MTHNLILIFLLVLAAGLSVYENYRSIIYGGGYNDKNLLILFILLVLIEFVRNM